MTKFFWHGKSTSNSMLNAKASVKRSQFQDVEVETDLQAIHNNYGTGDL